ncbi:MAG: thiol oxidoreductase [Rhodospirillaceae bacterium]|nr:thiol oxidoreductase [Rhodospirillaceae bacterium]
MDMALLGGTTTIFRTSREAFSAPASNLDSKSVRTFMFGRHLFRRNWIIAPASVEDLDGLGPLFNRVSCSGCHFKDGRGEPPEKQDALMKSMLVRLSIPGESPVGGPNPHPVYGDQLNDRAILGVPKEGRAAITYEERAGTYGDGTPYSLRYPTVDVVDLGYGPLGDDVMISPRVAPAVIGMGLLEAIPEKTLRDLADPDDADGDGISGRVNMVWDEAAQKRVPGRLGWKSNQPTVRQQIAGAFLGDMGLTTSLFGTQNCGETQTECQSAPNGGEPEVDDTRMDALELYIQTLAVPARRDLDDPVAQHGEQLFTDIGCGACHTPTLKTGEHQVAALSDQTIHPYSDLLVHNMGEELGDGRPDFEAQGDEWRTAPLWGIGLVPTVNGHRYFLHDGRARGFAEAILWHGGEAEKSREAFRTLSAEDRDALVRFLETL